MPYIKQEDREHFLPFESAFNEVRINTAGELNYLLTLLVQQYLHQNGHNYAHMNDVIGALEACKLELYRRLVAPYENTKIESNGDCYE